VLEQDIAISNIALDLVGQARNFYQYAASRMNQPTENGITEDILAYFRDSADFRNCLLVELEKGDWARTVLRQFFFSNYQYYFYEALKKSADKTLAAIAEKSFKEVTYHLRWSAEWVIRLGDGTTESKRRINDALFYLWPFAGELVSPAAYETELAGMQVAVDLADIETKCAMKISEVLQEAALLMPASEWMQTGGKEGRHTEQLGYLLAEMQYLQRSYPGNSW
jgi:ring-1,2-phenylacetyl-CoA epoxidase subunit PaaC